MFLNVTVDLSPNSLKWLKKGRNTLNLLILLYFANIIKIVILRFGLERNIEQRLKVTILKVLDLLKLDVHTYKKKGTALICYLKTFPKS